MIRTDSQQPNGVRWEPESPNGMGVLVLAGSSGRIDVDRARLFATLGCTAESIQWFGGVGQHEGPWEIPLEVFLERVDALSAECERVFVVGTSFGAEAALLCGAYSTRVDGVIAFSPTDVVWAGHDSNRRETSHWTFGGSPIPFVPLDWSAITGEKPPRFLPLYTGSRRTFAESVSAASIPVERIREVLLIAGGDDQVWPSAAHAEHIRKRRCEHGLSTIVVSDEDAGHRTILPGESIVAGGIRMQRGGSDAADRRLGVRAWPVISRLLTTGLDL